LGLLNWDIDLDRTFLSPGATTAVGSISDSAVLSRSIAWSLTSTSTTG